MHRLRVAAVVVFAVLLAAEVALHHHPFIPEGGGATLPACSVCAFGADGTTLDMQSFGAALVLMGGLVAVRTHTAKASAVLVSTAGRAPPCPR